MQVVLYVNKKPDNYIHITIMQTIKYKAYYKEKYSWTQPLE